LFFLFFSFSTLFKKNQPNYYLENKKKMVKKRKSQNSPKLSPRLALPGFFCQLERHKSATASFRNYKIKKAISVISLWFG